MARVAAPEDARGVGRRGHRHARIGRERAAEHALRVPGQPLPLPEDARFLTAALAANSLPRKRKSTERLDDGPNTKSRLKFQKMSNCLAPLQLQRSLIARGQSKMCTVLSVHLPLSILPVFS